MPERTLKCEGICNSSFHQAINVSSMYSYVLPHRNGRLCCSFDFLTPSVSRQIPNTNNGWHRKRKYITNWYDIVCHTMKSDTYKWRLRPKGWLKVKIQTIVITPSSCSNRLLAYNMHSRPNRVIIHRHWKFRHRTEMQRHFCIHCRILGLK